MQKLAVLLTIWIALSVTVVSAQQPTSCPAVVEQALGDLSELCGEMNRNTACYGNIQVNSTFQSDDVVPEAFIAPADRVQLRDIKTLETAPLDLATGEWGIAVLNAQANVPGTFPGQGVTFLLLGDAYIDNRITPEDALDLSETVEVTAATDAVLRAAPDRESALVDIVAVQTVIHADATDAEREWVRVLYNAQPAWVLVTEIAEMRTVDTLPIVTPDSQSPMQAFYFSTGIGQPDCNDAPDVITIQGREDFVVELSVNGAQVRIGSTIDFRTISEDQIAMTVREGTLEVVETGQVAVAGETIIALIDESDTIIQWETPRPATPEELGVGLAAQQVLASLFPGSDVDIADTGELIHIVVGGETLFGIGQQYDASLPAIVERNNLTPQGTVFVGQRLVIPNPGSGFVGLAAVGDAVGDVPSDMTTPIEGVTCAGFAATSPLDGLAFGDNTFYWDAPTDATGLSTYRVIVVNQRTGRIVSFDTPTDSTSVNGVVDQNTVGFGYDFIWQVQALTADGAVACDSEQVVLRRADVNDPLGLNPDDPLAAVLSASWGCVGPNSIDLFVNVDGAAPGESVLIEFTDAFGGPQVFVITGPSGSITYPLASSTASGGKVTADSGAQVILAGTINGCPPL